MDELTLEGWLNFPQHSELFRRIKDFDITSYDNINVKIKQILITYYRMVWIKKLNLRPPTWKVVH
ncbi:Uncharacterised protein [Escherichia coli]|uniref:Uncharacterized protein n=1 Tax=Escherichia coli TaxID=562 RepID=A0A2X1MZR3_ECOLX|nr:Uncharacterised protein [Escherichia coli]